MQYCVIMLCFLPSIVLAHATKTPTEKHTLPLTQKVVQKNRLQVLTAGAQTIQIKRNVLGKIVPNANKTLYLYPRYSGIIQAMPRQLGDQVEKNERLASIESDRTLQVYDLKAPFSGYIVAKNTNIGEHVTNQKAILRLADLSTVWVDLFIYRDIARKVHKGLTVLVYADQKHQTNQTTTINYVSPLGIEHNQTMLARATLDNSGQTMHWLPGLYVDTTLILKEKKVAVAVDNQAIYSHDNHPVVFVRTAGGFSAQPVKLGLKGQTYTEIKSGLDVGAAYVAQNSFLLKAELEKEQAEHSHH